MMDEKLVRNMAKCRQCNEVLESKHRHDLQMCGCPNKAHVDGGLEYLKRGAVDLSLIEEMSEWEEVETTEEVRKGRLSDPWIKGFRGRSKYCQFCHNVGEHSENCVWLYATQLEDMLKRAYEACCSEFMNCPWCSGVVGGEAERHDEFCPWSALSVAIGV